MKNPWIKKNPLMSMWLSGANAVLGSARSRVLAEGKRQAAIATAESAKQIAQFWSEGRAAPRRRTKKKKAGL